MKNSILFVFALTVLVMPYSVSAQQTITTTETAGTISEVSPDTLVVRSETSTSPIRYTYTKQTSYVDESGTPVSMETVKSGLPVTVYYTSQGNNMVAEKVVVRRSTMTTTTNPMMEQKQTRTTTTTENPTVEQKKTTTTTTERKY
jgi:hypothetical protein